MNRFLLSICVIAIILLLALSLVRWFDPVNEQIRTTRGQIAREQMQRTAELWLWAKRTLIIVGVLALSVAAMGTGLAVSRRLHIWARSVHAKDALYPQLVNIYASDPANERGAQPAAALVHGNLTRLTGSTIKQILNPRRDEAMLPQPDAQLLLPDHASIYTAPTPNQLSLPVGVNQDGHVTVPVANFGSGIIGGLMGLGKSEVIAAMIAGLLRQDSSGKLWQMGLIDMKGGADFGRVPDTLSAMRWPAARDPGTALSLVSAVRTEIDQRYQRFAEAGVPNIEAYNNAHVRVPYILMFVDEIMFLTMPAGDRAMGKEERQQSAEFISQMVKAASVGRAAGVGFIMATQRPSAQVIPTILRDLCSFRLAFHCANTQSSIAVLGQSGAEALPHDPGHALMLRGNEPVQLRTYMADVASGKFDRFVRGLPTDSEPIQLPIQEPIYRLEAEKPSRAVTFLTDIPIPTDIRDSANLNDQQRRKIIRTWYECGRDDNSRQSLNEIQRRLWPDRGLGGDKFWLVQGVMREHFESQGKPLPWETK